MYVQQQLTRSAWGRPGQNTASSKSSDLGFLEVPARVAGALGQKARVVSHALNPLSSQL
ncbi:hypothetical protein TBK1r_14860 [Stieleria magnilauensis]|uniref:Uncharacterized protein n=1 Tax=Stieleria magnilauensis TaxID=2527963 RepID=A0ABX5XNK0_9BACT|nr:hypothetical protein TBK1r_14860 [Planctomycetes bacterium TBK1r]